MIGVWLSLIAVQRTSVGIASTLTEVTPTAEALLERADGRLYRAKKAGRNRVMAS